MPACTQRPGSRHYPYYLRANLKRTHCEFSLNVKGKKAPWGTPASFQVRRRCETRTFQIANRRSPLTASRRTSSVLPVARTHFTSARNFGVCRGPTTRPQLCIHTRNERRKNG